MAPDHQLRHFLAAVAAAACAACAPLPAGVPLESSAAAATPAVVVGDTWTYRVRDGYTGLDRGDRRHSVVGVTEDRVRISVSHDGAREESQIYDRGWNWLKHPATNLQSFDYNPPYRAFDFPLSPGKTWRARLLATDPEDKRSFPVWIEGAVLGWERVKVPAGEFDALKIKRVVFIDYWEYTVRGRSEIVEFEWYAPAVKQAIRREGTSMILSYLYSDDLGGPRWIPDDWLISELVSYSVR